MINKKGTINSSKINIDEVKHPKDIVQEPCNRIDDFPCFTAECKRSFLKFLNSICIGLGCKLTTENIDNSIF